MTFSIVARDPASGALGVCVATGVACVGALAPHVSSPGAICTQAFVNVDLALRAMQLLDMGVSVPRALRLVLDEDPGREMRQVVAIGADGSTFAHTGSEPLAWAGHQECDDHVVAGNSLKSAAVLEAISEAYAAEPETEFTLRLIRAIAAGQDIGGGERDVTEIDLHVQNSAAVVVSSPTPRAFHNLRVDAAPDAIGGLLRVYDAAVASARMMEDFYEGVIELRPVTWRMIRQHPRPASGDVGSGA